MRRFLVILIASAMALAACGKSTATPTGDATASAAPSSASPPSSTQSASAATTSAGPTSTAGTTDTQVGAGWVVFTPDGAEFTSKFPVMPTVSASTIKTDVGYTASSLWTYSQGNDISYFVLLARYPAGSMAKLQAAKAYDAAIAGMSGGTSGLTLTAQSDISLNGHAGRSFLLTGKSGSIRGLIVLVGDNLYNAYVAFTPSADPASLDVFFANFKLTV